MKLPIAQMTQVHLELARKGYRMASQDRSTCGHSQILPQAHSDAAAGSRLHECSRRADEIIDLLEEESSALRSFNGSQLMHLLAKKEHLFNELKRQVESLASEPTFDEVAETEPGRARLRDRLRRIAVLNEDNRIFIQNTLAHYEDFLNCLCPSPYGRGQEGRAERTPVAVRGMAFTKEM